MFLHWTNGSGFTDVLFDGWKWAKLCNEGQKGILCFRLFVTRNIAHFGNRARSYRPSTCEPPPRNLFTGRQTLPNTTKVSTVPQFSSALGYLFTRKVEEGGLNFSHLYCPPKERKKWLKRTRMGWWSRIMTGQPDMERIAVVCWQDGPGGAESVFMWQNHLATSWLFFHLLVDTYFFSFQQSL